MKNYITKRDITSKTILDRVELFDACNELVNYTRCDCGEFGTVYECREAIIDRNINGRCIHLDISNLRWLCYDNGSIIIDGVINGVEYLERY